jgi:hypothetical protein
MLVLSNETVLLRCPHTCSATQHCVTSKVKASSAHARYLLVPLPLLRVSSACTIQQTSAVPRTIATLFVVQVAPN